jgi:hypothetical protein
MGQQGDFVIDDIVEVAVATAIDVAADKAARRYRWVRVLRGIGGLLFILLIGALVFVTLKYS